MTCNCIRVDQGDMVQLDTLLRHVSPLVPEVPYDMALDMVRNAYTEFARRTKLLASHQCLYLQKDVKNYFLEPPEGYEVFALLNITEHDRMYMQYPSPNRWFYAWGQRFYMVGNREIVFMDAPSRDDIERAVGLQLIPSSCVTDIPSEIATPYGRGIAMGALADMLDIPNKPWTNPRLAETKRREFSIATANGCSLHMTNRGAAPGQLRPVRIL